MLERRIPSLLHVEDDDLCLMSLHRAFRAAQLPNPIIFAHDGIEALDILRGTNGRPRLPRPFLILLDLNMPRMNGIEFLEALRRDEELKLSVVFVMTTSDAYEDRVNAYRHGVAGYILKTGPQQTFAQAARLFESYWNTVELPPIRG